MKIFVTGATGFIGHHLVPALLAHGHSVTALSRDKKKALSQPWWPEVDLIHCDIHNITDITKTWDNPEILVHLAWNGLPAYKSLHHFEKNLAADYNFIKSMVESGVKRVLVTGTCLEYGMKCGALSETFSTLPVTPYGLAKDCLRKFLQILQQKITFNLQWVRLFYTYGSFQNPNSLLAQLHRAIDNGDQFFNMSGGEQLRDYLAVEKIAKMMTLLVEHPECNDIVNCCKGSPISIRHLVEQHIKKRNANISLNLGYYPYPDYEPMAFWGDSSKLDSFLKK